MSCESDWRKKGSGNSLTRANTVLAVRDPQVEKGSLHSAPGRSRGRYSAERASQLSGIPKSTLYW